MPAALFLRITGVPWDEFCVAWRLYQAENKQGFLVINLISMGLLLTAILLTPYLDASRSLGTVLMLFGWMEDYNPAWSPKLGLSGLLPLVIPFSYLLIPRGIPYPIPNDTQLIPVCRQFLLYRMCLIGASICGIAIGTGKYGYIIYDLNDLWDLEYFVVNSFMISLVVLVPLFVIHSLLDRNLRPGFPWWLAYSIWAVAFYVSGSISWTTPIDISGDEFFNFYTPWMRVTASIPILLMFVLWRFRMHLLILYSLATLAIVGVNRTLDIPEYFALRRVLCYVNVYPAIGIRENMHGTFVDIIQ